MTYFKSTVCPYLAYQSPSILIILTLRSIVCNRHRNTKKGNEHNQSSDSIVTKKTKKKKHWKDTKRVRKSCTCAMRYRKNPIPILPNKSRSWQCSDKRVPSHKPTNSSSLDTRCTTELQNSSGRCGGQRTSFKGD